MRVFMAGLLGSLTLISVVILFLIVGYITIQGISGINLAFFVDIPKPLGQDGGGIAQAILGSLEMLAVGALIAVPLGVGTGIYMAEYGGGQTQQRDPFLAGDSRLAAVDCHRRVRLGAGRALAWAAFPGWQARLRWHS